MAIVSKGKQGRVKKWVTDGRLQTNRLKRKQEHDKAAWNELLGTPEKQGRAKPRFVGVADTEAVEAVAVRVADLEAVEAMAVTRLLYSDSEDCDAAVQGADEYRRGDDFRSHDEKADRLTNVGKCRHYIPYYRWCNLLWDKAEEQRSKRAQKAIYLPPNPVFWKLPLPWYWRERYHELSAKYPLIIALNFSDTFLVPKICQLTVSVCQNACLTPYRPQFARRGAAKSGSSATNNCQRAVSFCQKNGSFLAARQ